MNINDLSILQNFDEIKKFLEESADKDEISAKYIRQYLTQNISTIEKHFPVVIILNDNPDMLLEWDFKGCDFFCDSWRGSYNYPAAIYSNDVYDVETVIDNLRKEHVGFGLGFGYRFNIHENFSLGIEHQEYISFTNNLNTFNSYGSFIGNIAGNFSVKAIFKLGSKSTNEE